MSKPIVAQASEGAARRAIVARIAEVVGILRTAASELDDGGYDEMDLIALALRELAAAKKAIDLLCPTIGQPDPELATRIARLPYLIEVEVLPQEVSHVRSNPER